LFSFDEAPDMLVHFGADQNFILSGGSTKTSPSVDGITDHCKLHPIRGAHEPMHNLAAMNPNPEVSLAQKGGGTWGDKKTIQQSLD
jgi:hypothetical protein